VAHSDQPSQRGAAVLIDLENFLFGSKGLLSPRRARPILLRVLALIQDADYCIAVAPSWVIGHYVHLLHELSIPSAVVPPSPHAADLALLEQAEHLASIGYTQFIVLSGDHVFAELCRAYPTTVIVRNNKALARALQEAAESVITDQGP
jgi:hypothetical protein